jgi:hypothetical protein
MVEAMPNFGEIISDVEILRTGTHTASSGQVVKITDDDLSAIAANYNAELHEAPAVIGHPADNHPAYGWVKGLKVVGDRLTATLDLVPEFVEALRQGLFKKRSASIYPNLDGRGMYLRHVGFLGAVPPAIKALADINLKDDDKESYTLEFNERTKPMNWKDWFKKQIDIMPDDGAPMIIEAKREETPVQFTEEQVKQREVQAAEAAAKDAREKAELEFSEKTRKLEIEQAAATHKVSVKAKLEGLQTQGKVIPAWMKAGLAEFVESLSHHTEANGGMVINLAEDKKQTPYEWMISFLEALPKIVPLDEFAGGDKDTGKGGSEEKLTQLINEKLKAKPDIPYSMAFAEVQRENPDLAHEYLEGLRG